MAFNAKIPYSDLPRLPPEVDVETKTILKETIAARSALKVDCGGPPFPPPLSLAPTQFLRYNSYQILTRRYTMETVRLSSPKLELAWVLSSSSGYNLTRKVVTERLRHIMGLPTIDAEDAVQVAQAINWYENGMDFADALHLASSCEVKGFATLDGKMSRKALQIAPTQNILLVK
jgi:hypothetical protein